MATNKINVTAVDFSTSGNIANGTNTTAFTDPGSTNWTRAGHLVYTPNAVLWLGYNNLGVGYTRIYRCTDKVNYATWTAIDLPVAHAWSYAAYGNGRVVLMGTVSGGSTTITIYSTDEGATWGTGTAQTATIAAVPWGAVVYGNKFILTTYTGLYSSTDGSSWSLLFTTTSGLVTSGRRPLVYNSIIDRWLFQTSGGYVYMSTTNAGTAWTDISTSIGKATANWYVGDIISTGNYFVVGIRSDYPTYLSTVRISTNGTTWSNIFTQVGTSSTYGISSLNAVKDLGNGNVLIHNNTVMSMLSGSVFTYNINSNVSANSFGDNMGTNNTQLYNTNSTYYITSSTFGNAIGKIPINVGKLTGDRYIDVTASKTGATSVIKRLFIKQAQQTTPTYILYCNPGSFNLMSTLDGVVDPASFTNATTTLIVTKDGVDQTGWTFSTNNDTGLGASVSGSVLSITSLTNSVDLAYANISATKANEPGLLLKVAVTKNKSGIVSGINRGASLSSIITNSNTALSIKFLNTGMVQIKYGTGSYGNLIPWFSPVNSVSPPGGSWWMNMTTTGDAFTTSAGSGWLALSTSREFIFDKTGSPTGTYTCNMTVQFGTTSTGGNISVSTGTLQIIIP